MSDLRDQLAATLGAAYAIERELGGGGMSRVFLAEEKALGRKVVVKVLAPELGAGVNTERFQRETQLAARLQHPHIVPLLSAGTVEIGPASAGPYYTMPFVEGETLRARLAREGELPVADAVRVLRDVADALRYAHDHGVVHRDIKPENVLLSGGHAVVADFGVAKALEIGQDRSSGLTSVGMALGTPAYMAPEQAAADPATDHRADLYALGVVGYEILTGRPPFGGITPQQQLAAHATQTPTPVGRERPAVPPALAALIMRCLEKRPADRPQNAAEVVQALESVLTPGAGTVALFPVATAPRSRRWRWLAAAGGLGLAGLAYWQLAPSGGPTPTGSAPAAGPFIAVVPFSMVGGDTSQAYFGQGMAEEIANSLTKVAGLRVLGRSTTARAFAPRSDLDNQSVARGLGVTAVLDGTVERAGGRLRVGTQLTNVADGVVLWSEAEAHCRRIVDISADRSARCFGRLRIRQGRLADALAGYRAATDSSPITLSRIGYLEAKLGRRDDARVRLLELERMAATRYVDPGARARIYLGLGEPDSAIASLERAVRGRSDQMVFLSLDPEWDPLRADPRFQAILREIGLPPRK